VLMEIRRRRAERGAFARTRCDRAARSHEVRFIHSRCAFAPRRDEAPRGTQFGRADVSDLPGTMAGGCPMPTRAATYDLFLGFLEFVAITDS